MRGKWVLRIGRERLKYIGPAQRLKLRRCSALPVIIVQIGAWAQSLSTGKNVSAAQTAGASADKYAPIVTTYDLSGFYHYAPAAQLIIGDRVARVVKSLHVAAAAPR